MDPAKLKVVELRAELAALGLDTRGNKPILVERLREALAEQGQVVGDTTIADTTTEDVDEPGDASPPRTRRSMPAPRTRRRQSSTDTPVPMTPTRSSRREQEAVRPASPIEESEEPEPAVVAEPEPDAPADEQIPADSVEAQPQASVPVLTQDVSQETVSDEKRVEHANESKPSEIISPPEEYSSPTKIVQHVREDPSPVKESPVLPEKTIQISPAEDSMDTDDKTIPDETADESMDTESNLDNTVIENKEDNAECVESMDQSQDNEQADAVKTDEKTADDKDNEKKERRKREKHSRWSSSSQNAEPTVQDNDVQVTGEYINIRDDDDEKNRSRSRRPAKRPRDSSPRRKSPVRVAEPEIPSDKVTLSWYDSDLNLNIDVPNMNVGIPLTEGGFVHCWAGARASHGVKDGKVCYEVKVESMVAAKGTPSLRLGWSTAKSSLHLGDSALSWGFEDSARKVCKEELEEYGIAFKEKDVVGVYLDLESSPCTIAYTVNGETQGTAFEFDKDILEGEALYPHILSRSCRFKVNFGHEKYTLRTATKVIERQVEVPVPEPKEAEAPAEDKEANEEEAKKETDDAEAAEGEEPKSDDKPEEKTDANASVIEVPDGDEAADKSASTRIELDIEIDGEEAQMLEGYVFIGCVPFEQLVVGPQKPTLEETCEVIMMCGLPGSGKTFWTQKHVTDNPDKCFNVLGTSTLIEKMKVDFKPFKSQFDGVWSDFLSTLTKCVSKLIDIAQNRRRNYILDQTNVYPSAQRRKMREFVNCKRTAVVIVPDASTYRERQRLKEEKDGKDVPDGGVLDMKAHFDLPETCSWLEEVLYAELNEEQAKKMVEEYNKEGNDAGYGGTRGGRGRSHSGGRSSGSVPPVKRSRNDGPNDRNRHRGPDRGRHGGPMRNRNDKRDDRHRGDWQRNMQRGNWRPGWNYGRGQNYRDQPYGQRDYGGRDNRNRGMQSGPYHQDDRYRNRGGSGRDSRGGARMEGRGRGGMNDRNRENDRNRSSWNNQRGGSHSGSTGSAGHGSQLQPSRPNPQMRQSNGNQTRGGGLGNPPRGGGQMNMRGGQNNQSRSGQPGRENQSGWRQQGTGNWSQQGGTWQGGLGNWQSGQHWIQQNWSDYSYSSSNPLYNSSSVQGQSQQSQPAQQGQQWGKWEQWGTGQQPMWGGHQWPVQNYTAAAAPVPAVNVTNSSAEAGRETK